MFVAAIDSKQGKLFEGCLIKQRDVIICLQFVFEKVKLLPIVMRNVN